jgi:hypothetical protein
MRLGMLQSALSDLEHARDFYAEHGDARGDYFLDSLFADIDALSS